MDLTYKCQICGKICENRNGLASHINRDKTHHKDGWTVQKYIDTYIHSKYYCLYCHKQLPNNLTGISEQLYCNYSCKLLYEINECKKQGIKIGLSDPNSMKKARKTRRINYNGKWCSEKGQKNFNDSAWTTEAITNRKNTFNEHYGSDYYFGTAESIEQNKQTCLKHFGVEYPQQSYICRKKAKSKYRYNDLNFDSSWELAYYIFLRDFNIDFEFKPKEIPYMCNGVKHYTLIDFKVENRYVEIKGSHLLDENGNFKNIYCEDQTLIIEKQKLYNELNVKIITKDEILPYLKYVKLNYGSDFFVKHKRYIESSTS